MTFYFASIDGEPLHEIPFNLTAADYDRLFNLADEWHHETDPEDDNLPHFDENGDEIL